MFSQLESQFTIKNITTPATKFAYVVSNLTQEVAVRIPDIIASPPPGPYNSIKARLISMFVLSDYQKAETLVNLPSMGNQKPTVLMDRMLHLLPAGHDPCFLFKFLILQHLPADLQVLLMNDVTDLPRDLAAKADILWTARSARSTNTVSVDPGLALCMLYRSSSSAPSGQGFCWYHAMYKWCKGSQVQILLLLAAFGKLPLQQVGGSPAGCFPAVSQQSAFLRVKVTVCR